MLSSEDSVRTESWDEKLLNRLCIPVMRFDEFQRIVLLSSLGHLNKVKQVWQEVQGCFVGKMPHRSFRHTGVIALRAIRKCDAKARIECRDKG